MKPYLNTLIYEYEKSNFKWGQLDCGLFVANILHSLGAPDLAKEVRGQYSSDRSALRTFRNKGYYNYIDFIDKNLPGRRIPLENARPKDIIFKANNSILKGYLGICSGPRAYFLTSNSITVYKLEECDLAWSTSHLFKKGN
jgi:hypothetical protein